jgi:hypothetical protein
MSLATKFLIVPASVQLTPVISAVIQGMDAYFEKANLKAIVTSGLRDAEDQLRIIRQYLVSKGLSSRYPNAMSCGLNDKDATGNYEWQMAWSHLLNSGVIINPPTKATVLMDYVKAGRNLKGKSIPASSHFRGTAFDIGGGSNGVKEEAAVVAKAFSEGLPGLVSYLVERENNAIHCNCAPIRLA